MVSILVYFWSKFSFHLTKAKKPWQTSSFKTCPTKCCNTQTFKKPTPAIGPMHSPPNMAIIRSKETCSAAEGPKSSRVQRDAVESTGYQEATSTFGKILFRKIGWCYTSIQRTKKRLMICHYNYILWILREQHPFSVHKKHFLRRSPRCRTWLCMSGKPGMNRKALPIEATTKEKIWQTHSLGYEDKFWISWNCSSDQNY